MRWISLAGEENGCAYFIRRKTFPETMTTTTTMSTLPRQKLLLRRDEVCETGADIVLSNYLSKPQKAARFNGRNRSSSGVRSARGCGTDSRIRFACCSPLIITDISDRNSRETCYVVRAIACISLTFRQDSFLDPAIWTPW